MGSSSGLREARRELRRQILSGVRHIQHELLDTHGRRS